MSGNVAKIVKTRREKVYRLNPDKVVNSSPFPVKTVRAGTFSPTCLPSVGFVRGNDVIGIIYESRSGGRGRVSANSKVWKVVGCRQLLY